MTIIDTNARQSSFYAANPRDDARPDVLDSSTREVECECGKISEVEPGPVYQGEVELTTPCCGLSFYERVMD